MVQAVNGLENILHFDCLYEPLLPKGYKADRGWKKIRGVGHEVVADFVALALESLLPSG